MRVTADLGLGLLRLQGLFRDDLTCPPLLMTVLHFIDACKATLRDGGEILPPSRELAITHLSQHSYSRELHYPSLVCDDARRGWRRNFHILPRQRGRRRLRWWLFLLLFRWCPRDMLANGLDGPDVVRGSVDERVATSLRGKIRVNVRRHLCGLTPSMSSQILRKIQGKIKAWFKMHTPKPQVEPRFQLM